MFQRYWRSYPLWLQFLLLILLIFITLQLTAAILILFTKITGISPEQIESINALSPRRIIDNAMLLQVLSSISIFLLPALLFAYLSHPRPAQYLGLRAPGKPVQWLLVLGVIMGAMPILLAISGLIAHLNLGKEAHSLQEKNDAVMSAMLSMPSASYFLKALVAMAIVPAICEEFFFRGLFLRFLRKSTKTMVIPILFTGGIFAFAHGTVYNFFPIFCAGALLAVIYYLTGSLWCNILAHCVYNGFQIVLLYMSNSNSSLKASMDSNQLPVSLVIAGVVVLGISLFLLIKNKTPLPQHWAEDYTPEELSKNQF